MHHIITLAANEVPMDLPFPTIVLGVVAFGVFTLLALITWSYRDVANRHDHKSGNDSHH